MKGGVFGEWRAFGCVGEAEGDFAGFAGGSEGGICHPGVVAVAGVAVIAGVGVLVADGVVGGVVADEEDDVAALGEEEVPGEIVDGVLILE